MTDTTLLRVIAQTESADWRYAVRFESATYGVTEREYPKSLHNCQVANRCSQDTAKMICATSWGVYQMMGFNIYGDNSPCKLTAIGLFICDDICQENMQEYFLRSIGHSETTWEQMKLSSQVREGFISKYNGPGAVDAYWFRMVASAKYLGL